jgi:hypothetical protein
MWIAAIAALAAQDGGWLKSPEEAKGPAAKAGRPILLVTICAPPG